MYKEAKYNFIVIFLMVIIGFVAGASGGFVADTGTSILDDLPQEEIIQNEEEIDLGQFVPPSADANAYERLEFAFNVMEEGEGFTSQATQEVVSMGMTQKVHVRQYRGEGVNLAEEWHEAGFSQGKNQMVLTYADNQSVKTKKTTNTSKYSYAEKSYENNFTNTVTTRTLDEYLSVFKTLNSNQLTIDDTTTSLDRYDKRSDKNYYVITLSMNMSKIDSSYIAIFEENGTEGIEFSKITFEFKISKTTGFLYKVKKTENFTTDYGILKNISCESTMIQFYTQMNASAKTYIDQVYSSNFQ